MIGMSVLQILAIINVNLASRLPEGSHSYIYLADRLLEFPSSLLSVSLSVALLPTLSELWARGEQDNLVATVHKHLKMLFVLSLPSAVGLYIMAEPLIRLVFERGAFTNEDVLVTASVLQIYALVLIFSGTHRVIVPSFYAMKNTWLPACLSGFSVLVHFFVASWAVDNHGLQGLILATTFTGFLNLVLLMTAFKVYFNDLGLFPLIKNALHLAPALVLMGAFCFYTKDFAMENLGKYLGVPLVVVIAAILYFAVNKFTKHPEASLVLNKLLRRR